MNSCRTIAPCVNGATCNYTGPYTYTCTCAANYTGINCQHGTIIFNQLNMSAITLIPLIIHVDIQIIIYV